jgi:catechol 2,3-dioxygenase-like lactoylglutathione lyase family enzyme
MNPPSPSAAQPPPARPKIIGVAHIALWVSDVAQSRVFYKDFLGYEEPYQLNNPDGSLAMDFIKINDRQNVELYPGLKPGQDRLHHIAFYVEDAEAMRVYLGSRGVTVPDRVTRARIGTINVSVKDAEGHTVEFVQDQPDSWAARAKGKFLGVDPLSVRMTHVGFMVCNFSGTMKFYCDILGFTEFWRGAARTSDTVSWTNLRLPDSNDYIELMLHGEPPHPDNRGEEHHFCLEVPDIPAAMAWLERRPARPTYPRPIATRTGVNRKRQVNLYGPDGSRVELMEAQTIDGVPAPSSTLPLPTRT